MPGGILYLDKEELATLSENWVRSYSPVACLNCSIRDLSSSCLGLGYLVAWLLYL